MKERVLQSWFAREDKWRNLLDRRNFREIHSLPSSEFQTLLRLKIQISPQMIPNFRTNALKTWVFLSTQPSKMWQYRITPHSKIRVKNWSLRLIKSRRTDWFKICLNFQKRQKQARDISRLKIWVCRVMNWVKIHKTPYKLIKTFEVQQNNQRWLGN